MNRNTVGEREEKVNQNQNEIPSPWSNRYELQEVCEENYLINLS